MRLHKTDKGMPFIQLEEGQLFFVNLTADEIGYRNLRFHNYTVTELCTSAAGNKSKKKLKGTKAKTVKVGEDKNVLLDMELRRKRTIRNPDGNGPPNGTMKRKDSAKLREILSKYLDDNLIFPYNKIKYLKRELNDIDETKTIIGKTTSVNISSSKKDRIKKKKKRQMKRKTQGRKKRKEERKND